MGLVRKQTVDEVVPGVGGNIDISTIIRSAVATEIERQRVAKLERDVEEESDGQAT